MHRYSVAVIVETWCGLANTSQLSCSNWTIDAWHGLHSQQNGSIVPSTKKILQQNKLKFTSMTVMRFVYECNLKVPAAAPAKPTSLTRGRTPQQIQADCRTHLFTSFCCSLSLKTTKFKPPLQTNHRVLRKHRSVTRLPQKLRGFTLQ